MRTDELLQIAARALHVVISGAVAAQTVLRPTRLNQKVALLFGGAGIIIVVGRAAHVLSLTSAPRTADYLFVFDGYRRARNVDDWHVAGMGPGLRIRQGIVPRHRGRFCSPSPCPEQGAAFHVAQPEAASKVAA